MAKAKDKHRWQLGKGLVPVALRCKDAALVETEGRPVIIKGYEQFEFVLTRMLDPRKQGAVFLPDWWKISERTTGRGLGAGITRESAIRSTIMQLEHFAPTPEAFAAKLEKVRNETHDRQDASATEAKEAACSQ